MGLGLQGHFTAVHPGFNLALTTDFLFSTEVVQANLSILVQLQIHIYDIYSLVHVLTSTLETKQNSVTTRSSKTHPSLKQAICKACVNDGLEHPDVKRLSKLGDDGSHPQNCLREMETCLKEPSLSKAVGKLSVPVKVDENTN